MVDEMFSRNRIIYILAYIRVHLKVYIPIIFEPVFLGISSYSGNLNSYFHEQTFVGMKIQAFSRLLIEMTSLKFFFNAEKNVFTYNVYSCRKRGQEENWLLVFFFLPPLIIIVGKTTCKLTLMKRYSMATDIQYSCNARNIFASLKNNSLSYFIFILYVFFLNKNTSFLVLLYCCMNKRK